MRAWQPLIVALLLTTACPPPRLTNALIRQTPGADQAEARKQVHSRGRYRIANLLATPAQHALAPRANGPRRPDRSVVWLGSYPELHTGNGRVAIIIPSRRTLVRWLC